MIPIMDTRYVSDLVRKRPAARSFRIPFGRPDASAAGLAALIAALWPRGCLLCEGASGAGPLCPDCVAAVPGAGRLRCPRCALASPDIAPPRPRPIAPPPGAVACALCRQAPPPWQRLIVAGDYVVPLDGAIIALKYGHRTALARPLGELLAKALTEAMACRDDLPPIDILVPVPLAARRLAERGFNPARLIARSLQQTLARLPGNTARTAPRIVDALVRQRETRPQAGLEREARVANVAGAFARHPGAAGDAVSGRIVGLVDDVVTTGSTLAAAAQALCDAGAAVVIGLAVARTPPERLAPSRSMSA